MCVDVPQSWSQFSFQMVNVRVKVRVASTVGEFTCVQAFSKASVISRLN